MNLQNKLQNKHYFASNKYGYLKVDGLTEHGLVKLKNSQRFFVLSNAGLMMMESPDSLSVKMLGFTRFNVLEKYGQGKECEFDLFDPDN